MNWETVSAGDGGDGQGGSGWGKRNDLDVVVGNVRYGNLRCQKSSHDGAGSQMGHFMTQQS